ncbi:MAG: hypothetical protein HYT14_02330 [Candidatus Liptonbacteria bacterium]|nr:hypothetical protein [Candidatus Liptonbacteria bacterium]
MSKDNLFLSGSVVLGALAISGAFLWGAPPSPIREQGAASKPLAQNIETELPARWGTLGRKMAETGVIDKEQFLALYAADPLLAKEAERMLTEDVTEPLRISSRNAGLLLNLLWALGLGNKNDVLERGPMMDPRYGGADRFASTGGWTIARGTVMEHYARHAFITLTPEEQTLVERTAKNIYRPCCGNSAYFPDCNHGMAMLALLELMASEGATEPELYHAALVANSLWFPDTYATLERYFKKKGVAWDAVDPKEVLGYRYSSAAGYSQVLNEVEPVSEDAGGSCGV